MKHAIALPILALAACTIGPPQPLHEGAPAAIGETVHVGNLLATPQRVIEDSRCPARVQCVQAGRLVVSTRFDGNGTRETVPVTLGEASSVLGTTVTLAAAQPDMIAPRDPPRHEYRFIFESDH